MRDTPRTYYSKRAHPLLYVGEPLQGVSVLTLENYTKWYSPYLILPDGSVQQVDVRDIEEVIKKYDDARWQDHLFHPRLLQRLAKHLNAELDERALEVAIGRWLLESGHCDEQVTALNFDEPEEKQ